MTIFQKSYELPPFDMGEIYRYSGIKQPGQTMRETVCECTDMCRDFIGRVCFCEVPVKIDGQTVDLTFAKTRSADLCKNLRNCGSAVIFAATVGVEIDRLISKYGLISPSKAVILGAIGAERIEAACNAFCDDIKGQKAKGGKFTRPRFSPGYGDLPLEFQKDIFSLLDCFRKIGLSLSESLLMSPSKSVTAIVGISDSPCRDTSGCLYCKNPDCNFRKEP